MTWNPERATGTKNVIQGEYQISADPATYLSTVLGSCVSVCLHDPNSGIGGMNHFLLPFGPNGASDKPVRYGIYAMEVLINEILKLGGRKKSLTAKLFGAAHISTSLRDIGSSNVRFARDFLGTEGIPCVAESVGGSFARRVIFHPATGHARVRQVPNTEFNEALRPVAQPAGDNVTLF